MDATAVGGVNQAEGICGVDWNSGKLVSALILTITLTLELLVLVGLLVLSAFFSETEIALFSLSKLQLRRLRQ